MIQFLSLLVIIFLGANCQNHADSFVNRVSFSYMSLVGSVITIGLVAGFFSFRVTDLVVRLCLLSIAFVLFLLTVRRSKLRPFSVTSLWHDSFFMGIVPGFFLFTTGLLYALKPTRNMHFLLATWDGSSNPGMVTGLREFEQLNAFPPLRGLETYPAGAHYVASWLADLFPSSIVNSPLMTIHSFTALLFVSYGLIILLIGQLTNELGKLLKQKKTTRLSMGLLAQSLLLTPFFIVNLLMMFSLSFIIALTATLSLLLVLVKNLKPLTVSPEVRPVIAFSFALIIIMNTYQTFLLIAFFMLVLLTANSNTRNIFAHSVKSRSCLSSLMLCAFSLSLVVVQLTLTSDSVTSSTTSRFSMSGHIIAIDIRLIWAISLLSLGLLFFKSTRVLLGVFSISVCFTVLISWWLSESMSRAYGLNYYAKKSEYMLIVLLIPLAAACFGCFLRQISVIHRLRIVESGIALAVIIFSSLCLLKGPYDSLLKPSLENTAEEELMDLALVEAGIPGRSVVWYDPRPDISQIASLMSNYVDITTWVEPDFHSRTYIMAQQLSVWENKPWSESCNFLGSRFGNGRIVSIESGLIWECS